MKRTTKTTRQADIRTANGQTDTRRMDIIASRQDDRKHDKRS